MGVLGAIVTQLAKLHLQEFVKDCQQPKRFLYLCTFPVLQPVQHYLDGVCSYRSWIIKFTRASTQKREPPQKFGEGTKYSLLGNVPSSSSLFPQLNLVSSLVKISGRRSLVRFEKIRQTLGGKGRFTP